MKNLTTVEHDFPIYWNTYIMYGDSSGLEDGEKEIIDEFEHICLNGHRNPSKITTHLFLF